MNTNSAPSDDLAYLGLVEVGARIRGRMLTAEQVTTGLLARIDRLDGNLNSFIAVLAEDALKQARIADHEIAMGQWRGPLHGVPVAVKDLLDMAGLPTTAGSVILRNNVARSDSTVVRKLRDAGAIIIGKLHTTEAALLEHHPSLPRPRNPWSAEHWTGVSSSGSGVATAAGLCYGAIGTDTGGSIRMPASANGVTGLKPTWGRVSRHGLFPLAESLDHIGPMARSTLDVAAMLQVIAGADRHDPTALPAPRDDYLEGIAKPIDGVVIGIDDAFATDGIPPEIGRAIYEFCEAMIDLGAQVRPVTMPWDNAIDNAGMTMMLAELAQAHATIFPANAARYGAHARAMIEAGRNIDTAAYIEACRRRAAFAGQVDGLFREVDLLIVPALGLPLPSLSELQALTADLDHARRTLFRFTSLFNLAGVPSLTLPGRPADSGLPLGLQIVGGKLTEGLICRVGHAFQQVTNHHIRRPALGQGTLRHGGTDGSHPATGEGR